MFPIDFNTMPMQLTLLVTLLVHVMHTIHAVALAWSRHLHHHRAAAKTDDGQQPAKAVDAETDQLVAVEKDDKDDSVVEEKDAKSTTSSTATSSSTSSSSSSSSTQVKTSVNDNKEEDRSNTEATNINSDDTKAGNNSDKNDDNDDSTQKALLPEETLIIFDWDDTLFPTTALHKLSLFDMLQASEDQTVSNIVDSIQLMGRCITSVIRAAQQVGTVAVVTNASRSWMDETGDTFVRDAYNRLKEDEDIDLVSARDMYSDEDDYDCQYSMWKRKAIEWVVRNRFKMEGEGEEEDGEEDEQQEKEEDEEEKINVNEAQDEQDQDAKPEEKEEEGNEEKADDDDVGNNNKSDDGSDSDSDSDASFQMWRRRGDRTSPVRNIITIGDSEQEHIAVHAVVSDLPQCCMKQIWVRRLKTPRDHTFQLLEIMDKLNDVALKPGDHVVRI